VNVDLEVTPAVALAVAVFATSTSAILVRWSAAPSSVAAFYRVLFTTALVAPSPVSATVQPSLDCRGAISRVPSSPALHWPSTSRPGSRASSTSVAASVTLVQSQPIFVALGAGLLLGERISRETVLGIVVAIAGAAAMSLGAGVRPLRGDDVRQRALALLGAVTVAAYVLRRPLDPPARFAPPLRDSRLRGLRGEPVRSRPCAGPLVRRLPAREWLLFLGLAIGPGVFGHTVSNWVLEHLESVVVSVAWLGEPVGATLLALVLLAEVPDAITVVGGVVVIAGVFVTTLERERGHGTAD